LFTDKALERVYRITGGTPRLINILCDRAMLVAYSHDTRSVTHQDIAAAQKELGNKELRVRSKLLPVAAFVTLAFVAGFAGSQYLNYLQTQNEQIKSSHHQAETLLETKTSAADPVAQVQAAVQTPVSVERIQQLQQAIADLTIDQTVTQAYRATAVLWNQRPKQLPAIHNRYALKSALKSIGFNTVDFQGDLADLAAMNAPSILEIILPNVDGKRFLALVEVLDDQVRTVPTITASGWLTKQELQLIWFGRATLPYINFEKISMVDRPDQTGSDIEKVQRLLQQVDTGEPLDSGIYDRQTIEAVTRFQINHQLAPDGRVGPQTLFWLYKESGREMPRLESGGAS
jgi:general secretion pathway protein A